MRHLPPRELGEVDEPIRTTEINEGAEIRQRRHPPVTNFAGLELGQQAVLLLGAPFLACLQTMRNLCRLPHSQRRKISRASALMMSYLPGCATVPKRLAARSK